MSQNGFRIDKSLAFATQTSIPTSPAEGDIYRSADGLQAYHGGNWLPVSRESDNLATAWGDCEAALVSEPIATVITGSRTANTWAYKTAKAAPVADTTNELFGSQSYKQTLATTDDFMLTRTFTVPKGFAGKAINLSFLLNTGVATAITDYNVSIIRYTAAGAYAETITVQGSKFLGISTFSGFFIASSEPTDLYSLAIVSAIASTRDYTVDQFYFGQKSLAVGAAMTDTTVDLLSNWFDVYYGTTIATNISATSKVSYNQDGDKYFFNLIITFSGAANAIGEIIIRPKNFSVVTSKFATDCVGYGYSYHNGVSKTYNNLVSINDTTGYMKVFSADASGVAIASYSYYGDNVTAANNRPYGAAIISGASITVSIILPITGKSSGVTMLSSDRVKSIVRATRITSSTPIGITNTELVLNAAPIDVKAEFSIANGRFTPKTPGYFRFNYGVAAIAGVGTTFLSASILKNGTGSALGFSYKNDIVNSKYYSLAGDGIVYLNGTTDYISLWGFAGTVAGSADFGAGGDNSYLYIEQLTDRDALAMLPISARNIVGDVSGTVVPTGFVGETISSFIASVSAVTLTTNTYADVTSITLTPGVWDISCINGFTNSGGVVTGTILFGGIGTTSGNTSTGLVLGNTGAQLNITSLPADTAISIPNYRVTISVNTPYYLKAVAAFTVNTVKAYGRISAVRIA